MYKLIIISCLCLILNQAFAHQTIELKRDTILVFVPLRETYLLTGLNFNQFAQLETMVSPLVYKGIGAGASLGLQKRKNKTTTNFNAIYSKGNLYNNLQPKQYYAELIHFNISASACYEINKIQNKFIKPLLGWQVAQQSDFRRNAQFQNSNLSYNFTTTLSPVFRVEKRLSRTENKERKFFKKQRSMRLIYQLAIPLVAGVSRPPYNAIRVIHDGLGNAYQNSVTQEVITQLKIYSFNHFFALNSVLSFEYFLKNSTRISLQYYWNFENYRNTNSNYKVSQTGIQLRIQTRLNAF